mgnify:CR=1 FL=1
MSSSTDFHNQRSRFRSFLDRFSTDSLVAPDPLTDRTLVAVIFILTFIAALTAGLVLFGSAASARWQALLSSEVTVQIRPQPGRNIETDLTRAADLLKQVQGVTKVRIYSYDETMRMLEPWLGQSSSLGGLSIPRLIAVEIDSKAQPDIPAISKELARDIPGTAIDDHRSWTRRLTTLGNSLVIASAAGLILVMTATALAIVFATRGAMVGNREIVEVFYFMGADDRYIARVFQRHFFRLGLRGGILGACLALIILALLRFVVAGTEGLRDMFGFGIIDPLSAVGLAIVIAVLAVALFVSLLASVVSRITVHSTLSRLV